MKKLQIKRETLRELTTAGMRRAGGGIPPTGSDTCPTVWCASILRGCLTISGGAVCA